MSAQRFGIPLFIKGCGLVLLLLVSLPVKAAEREAARDYCPLGEAVASNGFRRLALIVGVGQYRSDQVPDLPGPAGDARRMYELLTGKNGYGFPKENVCMLLDEEATTAGFKQRFAQLLIDRAQANDVAVFYYAGHGSQTKDTNRDEPDEMDETFLLHDARSEDASGKRLDGITDDEMYGLLQRLHAKTPHVTVILDSCNSGSATRAPDAGTMIARFVPPDSDQRAAEAGVSEQGEGGAEWAPDSLPGLIVFTAASDGTAALENFGRGVFTDAILEVLAQTGAQPLTYAQAARQIPPLVSARSYQIPYFQGELSGPLLGNVTRKQPIGWEVIALEPTLKLGGPPLPGLGENAELRIYDGAVTGAETRDPSKAKATVVIAEMSGLNATAKVIAARPNAPKIKPGDLAIPVRVADADLRVTVRLKPAAEPEGIPAARAQSLRTAVNQHPEAQIVLELTAGPGEFELSVNSAGQLQLRGPENRVRKVYANDRDVADNLWQHARQKALLFLRGEGGEDFVDNQTLQVQLVRAPAAKQDACAQGVWKQAEPNQGQIIPLCTKWNVTVSLSKDAPAPLLVGGAILSTDGSSFGFPADGRKVLLRSGESVVFDAKRETFRATPPLDVWDHVIVFGTKESNPVAWHLLTSTASTRAATEPPKSSLYRALDRYLQPGTRGAAPDIPDEAVEDTTWSLSAVRMRVEAAPGS